MPDDVRAGRARRCAGRRHSDGYKLTLQAPRYLPVMQYATNRALRERLYRAYVTRASELGPPGARQQRADARVARRCARKKRQLLGYANYAELSLVPKMAESPTQVHAVPARPGRTRAPVRASATSPTCATSPRTQLGLADLQPWDHWPSRPSG